MNFIIVDKHLNDLDDYVKVPMLFEMKTTYQLKLIDKGLGGILFEEIEGDGKTYDPSFGEGPDKWKKMFDIKNWRVYMAYVNDLPVGGIALAYQTEGCLRLEGKDDLVVVWDLRVHPEYKGLGIGKALMQKAFDFSKEVNAKTIKVETQNNNTRACKFYQSQGFELGEINRFAYDNESLETMLIWIKQL